MRFKFSWEQVGENVISQARCREVGNSVLYTTDTRIGRGIMPPRIGRRLSLPENGAVPCGGRRGASLSPAADRRKRRCAVFRSLGFMVLQQKNLPPGGFSGLYESVVSWELFLLQKVPQATRQFCLVAFPFKRRLNDKGVSRAAACDQGLTLDRTSF